MEHLAGKGIDRVIRFIHSRRMKRWDMDVAPFATKANLKRFTILSKAVSGRELRVVELRGDTPPRPYLPILHRMAHPALLVEHGFGWCDGETIFLPVNVHDMPTASEQEALAKCLVFLLSAQAGCGTLSVAHANRALLSADRLTADLYWIIENTRLLRVLASDWPGLFSGWGHIAGHLMERRPPVSALSPAERMVEEFLAASVSGALSGPARTSSARESLALARRVLDGLVADGLPVRRYRAMVPFTPWGRLLPERLAGPDAQHIRQDNVLGRVRKCRAPL